MGDAFLNHFRTEFCLQFMDLTCWVSPSLPTQWHNHLMTQITFHHLLGFNSLSFFVCVLLNGTSQWWEYHITSISSFTMWYLHMWFNLIYGWEKSPTHSITCLVTIAGSGCVMKWGWWGHSVPGLHCLNMIWDVEPQSRMTSLCSKERRNLWSGDNFTYCPHKTQAGGQHLVI